MFEALTGAIDQLEIGIDEQELEAVARLRDRLEAKLSRAVSAFDRAELWDTDGSAAATSRCDVDLLSHHPPPRVVGAVH